MISVFALLNGVLGLVRVNVVFPLIESGDVQTYAYMVTYMFESICFFGAIWFFSVKYYEYATELKIMLSRQSPQTSLRLHRRKRTCLIYRWLIFALLVASQVLECIGSQDEGVSQEVGKVMYTFGYVIISIVILVMAGLIAMALYMFISIVAKTP